MHISVLNNRQLLTQNRQAHLSDLINISCHKCVDRSISNLNQNNFTIFEHYIGHLVL